MAMVLSFYAQYFLMHCKKIYLSLLNSPPYDIYKTDLQDEFDFLKDQLT